MPLMINRSCHLIASPHLPQKKCVYLFANKEGLIRLQQFELL
ncbi:hypothetical protein VINE108274_23840 [Vibrio neptunius]